MPKSKIFRMEKKDGKTWRVMYYWDAKTKGYKRSKFPKLVTKTATKSSKKSKTRKLTTEEVKRVLNKQSKPQPAQQSQVRHAPQPRRAAPLRSGASDRLINSYSNLGR